MKRKLFAALLAVVSMICLSIFGVTAFADEQPTYIHVSAVNMDTAWIAVGIQVSDSANQKNMTGVTGADAYVTLKNGDGSVLTPHTYWAMGANLYLFIHDPATGAGNWIGLSAGATVEVKAGCPFIDGEVIETGVTYEYNGSLWTVKVDGGDEDIDPTEITVAGVYYSPADWGCPSIIMDLNLANDGAYGQYAPGDLAKLSYVNAYGETKPLADCLYILTGNWLIRMAQSVNPNVGEYYMMTGDKFTIKNGFTLTSTGAKEQTMKEYVYIAAMNANGYYELVPYVPATHDVTSFEITNDVDDNVVYIDTNKQLTFTANDGALFTPKFTSSNEDVLTVDANGVMTGVAAGTATVTAKAGTIEKTYNVVVKAAPVMTSLKQKVAYEIVALKGEEAKIPANFSVVKVYNDGSESAPIMLTAENARFKETVDTSVVPDVTGKIKATLVVTVDGKDYEFEQWVRIHEVSVIDNFKECAVVEWFGFASFVEFPNNTTNKANFTDVSALKDYFDHIEYYRDGEKISCGSYLLGGGNIALFPAHAQPEVQEITLENYGTAMYKKGDTVKLLAGLTVYGHTGITDANNGVWSDEEGMLYKDAILDHDVMFRFNGIGWDLYVPYTDVTVENATMEVALGTDNATVGAKRVPDSATVGKFSYTVDKPEILTVAENGKITAKKVGTAVITITLAEEDGSNAKTTTVTVTVVNKIVKLVVEKLVIEKGTQTIDLSLLKGKYVYGDGTEEIATDLATGKLAGFDPESEDAEQNLVIRVTHNGVDYTATVIVSFADDSGACIGSVNVETYAAIAIALAAFSAVVLLRKKQEN